MTAETSHTAARILIADDDNALRHAIGKILKGCGYEVTSFDNGADALEALQDSALSSEVPDPGDRLTLQLAAQQYLEAAGSLVLSIVAMWQP